MITPLRIAVASIAIPLSCSVEAAVMTFTDRTLFAGAVAGLQQPRR